MNTCSILSTHHIVCWYWVVLEDLGGAGGGPGWCWMTCEVVLDLGSHALNTPSSPLQDLLQTMDQVPQGLSDQNHQGQRHGGQRRQAKQSD